MDGMSEEDIKHFNRSILQVPDYANCGKEVLNEKSKKQVYSIALLGAHWSRARSLKVDWNHHYWAHWRENRR